MASAAAMSTPSFTSSTSFTFSFSSFSSFFSASSPSPLLSPFYDFLVKSDIFTTCPMLEAYVAAFSFFFWHLLFLYMTRVSSLKRYRFSNSRKREESGQKRENNTSSTSMSLSSLFSLFSFINIHSTSDVVSVLSLPVYLLAISLFHTVKPHSLSADWAVAPSLFRLLSEVLFGIVAYDFVFFFVHLLLHRSDFLYRHVHKRHHTHSFLSVGTTVSHSLLDGTLQVSANILVQHLGLNGWGTKHPLSRLLHNVVVTYMLCEIHSEMDAPFSMHNLFPKAVGGALRHRLHHQKGGVHQKGGAKGRGGGGVNYQEFFLYLDDFFGTAAENAECRRAKY